MKVCWAVLGVLLLGAPVGRSASPPAAQGVVGPRWVTSAVKAPGVQFRTFESRAAGATVSYHVCLPPSGSGESGGRLPVVYWLHGTGGGVAGVAPVSAFFRRAMETGRLPPLLVVFPNGLEAGMWCDARDGSAPVESVVVGELVPLIDATFRTIPAAGARVLEGFSMGGYGAARWAARHPDVFGVASILAGGPLDPDFQGPRAAANPAERERILGATFGGDLAYFRAQSPWMLAEANAPRLAASCLRIVVGDRDFTAPLNQRFSRRLGDLGIRHELRVVPGVGHDALGLLRALGDGNWDFHREALRRSAAVGGAVGAAP